ncbi:MAG: serine hydrolase [Clostridia bacterium]|nr:serine hydrolase [Clostridia bacterium]
MVNDLIFCAPEQVGISSKNVLTFMNRLKDRKTNLHSFMMVRDGKIFAEAYSKPFHKDFMHRLYSSSKTFVSMAIGKLIGEGKIKLEDKIMDLLPEFANHSQHRWIKECTVEDALKMAVPMLTDTYFARDYKEWAWTFFNHPQRSKALKPAGTIFNYNTSGTFILGVIVEKITGKTFLEYLRPEFDKIGVSKDIWCVKSPDGYAWGGSGVVCTLRDFAKFAELILYKGNYKGEQLLPRDYIEKATTKQIFNVTNNHVTMLHNYGYGYQIWITKHGFALLGMGCESAFCFPDKNLMFVCQGDTQCNGDTEADYLFEQFTYEIYEKMQDQPLESDDNYKLKKAIEDFKLNVDYGKAHSDYEKQVNGKIYDLDENAMGWKWFKFDFDNDKGKLTYENARGIKVIEFGYNNLLKGKFPETNFYGEQVDKPSNRQFDSMSDLSWVEDRKILLRNYIIDSSLGSCFMIFSFKGNDVGISMQKRAEFFMSDYQGFAGGTVRE